jgi:exodeoxyribonuclease V gamma subunit
MSVPFGTHFGGFRRAVADFPFGYHLGVGEQDMRVARFIHGNRLELLADRLIEDLREDAGEDPMRPQTVVVAHPALGRWLQERIAAHFGIAANIEFPLPSKFAWDVMRAADARLPETSAFSRSAMTWRIWSLLPALSNGAHFAAVRHYLGDGSDSRLRYDLSVALARVFDEYMVARPRWLRAWRRGERVLDDADEIWQAELWQALAKGADEPDRASLMQGALASLESRPDALSSLPEKVRVFGASFLPPLLLEFLLGLGRRIPLDFYQPNPCLDYWGDVVSDRELARRQSLWKQHGRRDASEYFEIGHPLLASWGALGREYLKAIHAPDLVIHDDGAFEVPSAPHLLGWLQRGLLLLDPAHAAPPTGGDDASIRIHGCPNRRREVEVLRDQLLLQIERLDDLKPHEIVVMSPRLEEYTAYIDAVFGDADDALAMPYSIGDVPLRRSHPLLDAFSRLLELGDSRFTASEVLGLIGEPPIARRFDLDDDGLEWIRTWVRESGIRWGLDEAFRAAVGAAALSQNTWRFGLDRLLLGYAQGDAAQMLAGKVPAPNVEGSAAQALGQLARFIDELDRLRKGLVVPRSAQMWKLWFNARIDAVFDTQTDDSAEIAALAQLRDIVAECANTAGPWIEDEALPFDVVRMTIVQALDEPRAARGGRFGIRFRSMVPMRNVPHRVVCLLGLNAGEFPRRPPAEGFHLMRRYPQAGDRSVREDDRFLFLECMIAARDALHLSFVDRDERAGTASPPSTLIDELTGFLRQHNAGSFEEDAPAPTLRHHPMQAFDIRCFSDADARQSYDSRWLAAARALARGWQPPPPFVDAATLASTPLDVASADTDRSVELESLLNWLRHPAKAYFGHALPLRMSGDESIDDTEPFGVDGLTRYQLIERLLGDPGARPQLDRVQGEGIFPLGPLGDNAWQALSERAAELDVLTVQRIGNVKPAPDQATRSLAVGSDGLRLVGRPQLVFDGRQRVLLLRRPGRIRGFDLARLALERELLATDGPILPAFAIGWDKNAAHCYELAPLRDAAWWIENLLAIHAQGLHRPLSLYRKPAEYLADAKARDGKKLPIEAAREIWENDAFEGGNEPFNALIARHRDEPLDEEFRRLAESIFLPLYLACAEVKP